MSAPPDFPAQVAAIMAALALRKRLLKQYQWTETTVVDYRGEEKARIHARCFYGPDGRVQKVALAAAPLEWNQGKILDQVVESNGASLMGYARSALKLLHAYVSPDPTLLHAPEYAEPTPLWPDGLDMHLNFHDYRKPGDTLSVRVDCASHTLLGLRAVTWLEDPHDNVVLSARFGTFSDGAAFPTELSLSAQRKLLLILVTNTAYHKQAQDCG